MLGDCILHLTHHEMAAECWGPVIEHYQATAEACPDWPHVDMDALHVETVNSYKAAYERALLDALHPNAMTIRTEPPQ